MQLRVARLCHDCEEIHADGQCPVCASETFTFITRWVPAPERRKRPRPASSPDAEVYRALVTGERPPSTTARLLKRAAVGVTALSIAGWLWRSARPESGRASASAPPSDDDGTGRP